MKRHRDQLKPIAEMNVTNLLDTAFILLMAFMIVAPSIKHGIEIDLPQVSAQNIDSEKTVTVVLQEPATEGASDKIYVGDQRMTFEQLREELIRQKQLYPKMDVTIEGDKTVTLETFTRTVAAIQAAGIDSIGIMTEPEL